MRIAKWVKTAIGGIFCAALITVAATQLGDAEGGQPVIEAQPAPTHATFTAELAHRWPTCAATADFPDGHLPAFVLTQPFTQPTAAVRPMSFDRAWTLNQDHDPTNDVWWVAKCRREEHP